MKLYEISWFNEFSCLCGDCPRTCCRGWVIPLSEQDCERLRTEKGWLALRLFFATGGWTRAKFNISSGNCTFLREDGLCTLQKKKGHEFIPWTCQSFPRFYRNYGEFEERCLDLSCIGAARLFMKYEGATDLTASEGDPCTKPCTTNDDKQLMEYLLDVRREMMELSLTADPGCFTETLFLFAGHLQDDFSKGGADLPSISFIQFYEESLRKYSGVSYSYPLPVPVLKAFLGSSLCHIRLRSIEPDLYKLFAKAKKYIGRFDTDPEGWQREVSHAVAIYPLLGQTLARYLSYFIFQYFMRAYETYSFRRQIALGLCHMNMILLLTLSKEDPHGITEETLADTIALYNRRAFFNDDIQDQMYRIFEDGFKSLCKMK